MCGPVLAKAIPRGGELLGLESVAALVQRMQAGRGCLYVLLQFSRRGRKLQRQVEQLSGSMEAAECERERRVANAGVCAVAIVEQRMCRVDEVVAFNAARRFS